MKNFVFIFCVFIGALNTSQAAPTVDSSYYSIASMKTTATVVPESPLNDNILLEARRQLLVDTQLGADPLSIINTLLTLWQVIESNKPVVNINTKGASALPDIAKTDWTLVTGWKPEHVVNYKVEWSNPYGMKVISLDFEVRQTYGGSLKGKGQYIAVARVVPVAVNVDWGFDLNVNVNVPSVTNRGTVDDPLAEIAMEVTYQAKGMFQNETVTEPYLLRGDGYFANTRTHQIFFKGK